MSKFKEKTKLYFKKRRQRVSVSGISIDFDWKVLFSLFILACLASIVYAFWMYYSVATGSFFSSETREIEGTDLETQHQEVENVVRYLQNRSF